MNGANRPIPSRSWTPVTAPTRFRRKAPRARMRPALREVVAQHDRTAVGAARGPLDPGAQNAALPHVDLRHALREPPAGAGGRAGAEQQVGRARFLPRHDLGHMGMPMNAHARQRIARRERTRPRERDASRGAGPVAPADSGGQGGRGARAAACEMDTVVGLKSDRRCLLTLYLRAFRFQLALLMPDKTAASTESALDMLERAAPRAFARLFPLLLTDNGAEFSDCAAIERSALDPAARRCSVYYCDVRQSQQKGGCERNHVEVRKILPKGRGISFDRLGGRDCAVLMSHLNSEPRPSLGGMCAIDMLLAALGADGRELLDALGVEKVPYGELDMTVGAVEADRRRRGEGPLMP